MLSWRHLPSPRKTDKGTAMKAGVRFLAFVLLAFGLAAGGCTTPPKKKTAAHETKPAKVKPGQEASDVDFDAFISPLRKAGWAQDMNTIAQMMTPDFGSSLKPEKSGEGAFPY